jgi:dUTP pyrophosphatase
VGRASSATSKSYAGAMNVGIRRVHPGAQLPSYQTSGSVGFDLCTAERARIAPESIALVSTGLVIATPPGWALLVCLRSSTPGRFGVIQPHGVGVIDQDYRGSADELRLQLLNYTTVEVVIPEGSRLAQGVFVRVEQAVWYPHEASDASRGGFGSTNTEFSG